MALPAFLLLAVAGWGQSGTIGGKVTDENGQPVKDAVIKIDRLDIKQHWQTKTNKKGEYVYTGFAPNADLRVTVEIDGKVRDAVDHVKPGFGEPKVVDFDLKQASLKQANIQKQVAAGGALSKDQLQELTPQAREAYEKQKKKQEEQIAKQNELNNAFNTGLEALNAKQYDVAAQALEKASQADAKQPAVWANLGEAYSGIAAGKTGAEQEAEYGKAIEAYNQALTLTPDNANFHTNLATILAKAKKFPEAQAEVAQAAKLEPATAARGYFNLGAILVNSGQYDEAGEAFKKAIEANPNYAEAQYQYAVALSAKLATAPDGKIIVPDGMKEALEKYLALDPNGPYAEPAKGLLQSIGGTVETQFNKPNTKKKK